MRNAGALLLLRECFVKVCFEAVNMVLDLARLNVGEYETKWVSARGIPKDLAEPVSVLRGTIPDLCFATNHQRWMPAVPHKNVNVTPAVRLRAGLDTVPIQESKPALK